MQNASKDKVAAILAKKGGSSKYSPKVETSGWTMSTFYIKELNIGLKSCTLDKAVEISVGKSGNKVLQMWPHRRFWLLVADSTRMGWAHFG